MRLCRVKPTAQMCSEIRTQRLRCQLGHGNHVCSLFRCEIFDVKVRYLTKKFATSGYLAVRKDSERTPSGHHSNIKKRRHRKDEGHCRDLDRTLCRRAPDLVSRP